MSKAAKRLMYFSIFNDFFNALNWDCRGEAHKQSVAPGVEEAVIFENWKHFSTLKRRRWQFANCSCSESLCLHAVSGRERETGCYASNETVVRRFVFKPLQLMSFLELNKSFLNETKENSSAVVLEKCESCGKNIIRAEIQHLNNPFQWKFLWLNSSLNYSRRMKQNSKV